MQSESSAMELLDQIEDYLARTRTPPAPFCLDDVSVSRISALEGVGGGDVLRLLLRHAGDFQMMPASHAQEEAASLGWQTSQPLRANAVDHRPRYHNRRPQAAVHAGQLVTFLGLLGSRRTDRSQSKRTVRRR